MILKNRAAFIFPENSGNKGTAIRILTDTYSALDGSVFQVNKAYSSILVKRKNGGKGGIKERRKVEKQEKERDGKSFAG